METLKHIITSGCSFTRQEKRLGLDGTDSDFMNDESKFWRWPHHIQNLFTSYKIYNLGNPTNDNSVIVQSTIKKITDLLNDGINPKDIKVIVQWSEQNRNSFFISNDVAYSFNAPVRDKDINQSEDYITDYDKWSHLSTFAEKDHFDYRWGYYLLTGGYEVNHINYPKDIIKIHGKYYSHQESAIRFFSNILLLQNFCKINKIEDVLMFNLSYNFITDKQPDFYDTMEQVYVKKELPVFDIDFKTDNPYISYLYQNIDFSKFWFYKNKYTNVGGQLEWAISEFDYEIDKRLFMEHRYVDCDLNTFCNTPQEYEGSTGHVSSEMNKKFVNTILKPFLQR